MTDIFYLPDICRCLQVASWLVLTPDAGLLTSRNTFTSTVWESAGQRQPLGESTRMLSVVAVVAILAVLALPVIAQTALPSAWPPGEAQLDQLFRHRNQPE